MKENAGDSKNGQGMDAYMCVCDLRISQRRVDATKIVVPDEKNDEHTATTIKNQGSFTGHSLWFLHGHSGSLEVTRCHFGHSLHGHSIPHTLDAHVLVSKMHKELYTRSHRGTKVMAHGKSSRNIEKVSALTPI